MQCEICGKDTELIKAIVEGTELNVCEKCGSFGKIVNMPAQDIISKPVKQYKPIVEEVEAIVSDYGPKIKNARESMKLNQKEFALKLFERESIIRKIENNAMEPTFALAKKIEKLCSIKLIEKETIEHNKKAIDFKSEGLTIGDLLKTQNEKK